MAEIVRTPKALTVNPLKASQPIGAASSEPICSERTRQKSPASGWRFAGPSWGALAGWADTVLPDQSARGFPQPLISVQAWTHCE